LAVHLLNFLNRHYHAPKTYARVFTDLFLRHPTGLPLGRFGFVFSTTCDFFGLPPTFTPRARSIIRAWARRSFLGTLAHRFFAISTHVSGGDICIPRFYQISCASETGNAEHICNYVGFSTTYKTVDEC